VRRVRFVLPHQQRLLHGPDLHQQRVLLRDVDSGGSYINGSDCSFWQSVLQRQLRL
jgi:hypothetical protein